MIQQLKKGTALSLVAMAFCQGLFADDLKPNGLKGVSLTSAYPQYLEHDMSFNIGFLVEEARVTGTNVATLLSSTYNTLPQDGSIVRPTFSLDWGITAGLGYYIAHGDWMLHANFDWLRSSAGKNISTTAQIIPYGQWIDGIIEGADGTYFTGINTTMKINYYNLQLDLLSSNYATQYLSLEPFMGLKTTWIIYDQNTRFTGGSITETTAQLVRTQESDFWGIGPDVGLNTQWALLEGFSFFGDFDAALLIGRTKSTDTLMYANQTAYKTLYSENHTMMSPALRATIGLMYERCFFDGQQHVAIKGGFDTAYYFNQYNHIDVFQATTTNITVPQVTNLENCSYGMLGFLFNLQYDF